MNPFQISEFKHLEDVYIKKVKNLEKFFVKSPYSSKSFYFCPTENDWKIMRKYIPTILIYITNRCNNFCKICSTNSTPFDYSKELSKKDIIKILQKIGRKKRIILIGGEPTIRDDLFDIIEIIRKSGNHPELFTNGLRLSNFDYAKKLKKAGVKRIYFSFDGFKDEIYEKMNGNSKEIILKLLALRNLEILEIDTIISARIAMGVNEDQVKNLIDFCANSTKKGGCIRGVHFYGATHYGRFLLKDSKIYTSELVKLVENATNYKIDLDYLIEIKKLALNLFKISSTYNIPLNFGSGGLIGLYKADNVKIKKLFPISFVRKINKYFEMKKTLHIVYESLKNKEVRKIILRFICGKDLIKAVTKNRVFIIGVGNVNTPLSYQPYFSDSIGLERGKGENIIALLANYSSGESS
jgi:uncharacterized radical SAM superfamily Fe-S cluster-containing enzyme